MAKNKLNNIDSFQGIHLGFESSQDSTAPITLEKEKEKEEQRKRGRPKKEEETKQKYTMTLYPSVYSNISKISYVDRESISEIVNNCLEQYALENKEKIEEYNRLKGE